MRFPLALFILAACDPTSPDKAEVNDSLPVVSEEPDADNDGYSEADGDCDDDDADRYPGAPDDCDGVDNDCDYETDEDAVWSTWYPDQDKDGYGDQARGEAACAPPEGAVADGTDCNDHNAAVNSDVAEVCNGMDDDCDGETDEEGATGEASWHADVDGDGFGDPNDGLASCVAPEGYLADATDCDDGDEEVNPTALELCDGVDNDCNGEVDEDSALDAQEWYEDGDGDGFGDMGSTAWACDPLLGYTLDDTDCDDFDSTTNPDAGEYCDEVDNDCNGAIDDFAIDGILWGKDADADGYAGDVSSSLVACLQPYSYVETFGDCDDGNTDINPAAIESADNIDNNCDGNIDEGPTLGKDVAMIAEDRATTAVNCQLASSRAAGTTSFGEARTYEIIAVVMKTIDWTTTAAEIRKDIVIANSMWVSANVQFSLSQMVEWDSYSSSVYPVGRDISYHGCNGDPLVGSGLFSLLDEYVTFSGSYDSSKIYVFYSDDLGGAGGYAYIPPLPSCWTGNLIAVVSQNMGGDTLAHELGHYLGSPHTFANTYVNESFIPDGFASVPPEVSRDSDCSEHGDLRCDTYGDPGPRPLNDDPNINGCSRTCTDGIVTSLSCGVDSAGVAFDPLMNNVMSYYSCTGPTGGRSVTAEQIEVAWCVFENIYSLKDSESACAPTVADEADNIDCNYKDDDCDGDPDDEWDESQDSDGQSECDGDCDDDDGDTYDSFKHAFRYTDSSDNWITGFGTTLQTPLLGDVDNDGMADAVGFYANGDWYVALATSYSGGSHDAKGDYFATESRWIEGFGDGSTEQFLADVNGDFRQDAVIFRGDTGVWGVALSSGSAFVSMSSWVSDSGTDRGHGELSDHVMMGDVNGDGMSDIVSFYRNNGESYSNDTDGDGVADADGDLTADNEWWVAYSTGADFGNGVDGSSAGYHLWISGFGSDSVAEFVADVDGDGCADAVIMESDGDWRYISGGCGSPSSAKVLMAGSSGERADLILMGDVDGDGLSDAGAFYVSSNDGDLVDVNGYIGATLDTDGDGIDDHDAAGLSAVMKVGLNNWGTLDSDFLSQYWIEDFGADANRVFLVNVDETYADPALADLVAFYASTGTWKVARAVGWECSDEED